MPITLQGLQLSSGAAFTSFDASSKTNIASHSIHGSDVVSVEITSKNEDTISFDLLLNKEDASDMETVEFLVGAINGLKDRQSPLLLESTEVPIWGGSKKAFIAIADYNLSYRAGTRPNNLVASVGIKANIIGTPRNVIGRYGIRVLHRESSFDGEIASRSLVAAPLGSSNFNVPVADTRNGSIILDLGTGTSGFANDTLSAKGGDTEFGEVTFNIDSTEFIKNAIKVFDGETDPLRRIYSKDYEFDGDVIIENEIYKIVISDNIVNIYNIDSQGNTAASPDVSYSPSDGYTKVIPTHLTDEFVRFFFDNGDYLEIERGKHPVIRLSRPTEGLTLSDVAAPGAEQNTSASENFIDLGDNMYIASNHHFKRGTDNKIEPVGSGVDIVWQLFHSSGGTPLTQSREILVELGR